MRVASAATGRTGCRFHAPPPPEGPAAASARVRRKGWVALTPPERPAAGIDRGEEKGRRSSRGGGGKVRRCGVFFYYSQRPGNYSLRPRKKDVFASRETTTGNYILKYINIYAK
jgi:hypothetical protein